MKHLLAALVTMLPVFGSVADIIPESKNLKENDIIEAGQIPVDMLICECDSAEELGLLFEKGKGLDSVYEGIAKSGRYLKKRTDIQFKIDDIWPVSNTDIKLIKVVGVGTTRYTGGGDALRHYGYIPSNVWDARRNLEIEKEAEAENAKKEKAELKAREAELDNIKAEIKELKAELK